MRKSKRLLQSLACCAVVLTMCATPLTTAAFAASAATVVQEDGSSDDETAAYTFIVMVNDTAAVRPGSGTAVYPGNPNASDIRLTLTTA